MAKEQINTKKELSAEEKAEIQRRNDLEAHEAQDRERRAKPPLQFTVDPAAPKKVIKEMVAAANKSGNPSRCAIQTAAGEIVFSIEPGADTDRMVARYEQLLATK